LVLCAKIDEADNWRRYAKECGREKSLFVFNEETGGRFNFLDYAMLTNKTTSGAVDMLMNVLKVGNGEGVESTAKDKFWDNSVRQLISHSLDLLYSAYGTINLVEVGELVQSTAQTMEEGASDHWNQTSFFALTLNKIYSDPTHPMDAGDLRAIQNYFLKWTRMEAKTRTNIEATLTTALQLFEKGSLREMFTTTSNIVLELTHEGAILVVDLPEHSWGQAGIVAQHIIKYAWQRAAMRRIPDNTTRPIFLWGDESHYFITSYDATFQSTARSYRAATVYMTQSINAYKDAIGGAHAHDTVMSLIGNLRTQIFHQTNSPDTQKYAAEMVGKGLLWRENVSEGETQGQGFGESDAESLGKSEGSSSNSGTSTSDSGEQFLLGMAKGRQVGWSENETTGSSKNRGTSYNKTRTKNLSQNRGTSKNRGASQQKDYILDPSYFRTALRTGGEPNGLTVDGVVVAPNLPNYLHIHFNQV